MNQKRIIAFSILALVALSLTIQLTAAADPVTPPATQATKSIGGNIAETLTSWWNSTNVEISDNTKAIISKILLMILVVLMIYSLISFVPIFPKEKNWIPWVVSGIIGLLSFLFVSADDIKYILNNYQALGIVLTSILPLIIIIVFTMKIRESGIDGASFINKLILSGFVIYLAIKWITTSYTGDLPEVAWLYPLALLAALIWVFIEKKMWLIFHREKEKETTRRAGETTTGAAEETIMQNLSRKIKAGRGLTSYELKQAKKLGLDVSSYLVE